MSILKNTRLSQDRQIEYQIEYTAVGRGDEYRVRHGIVGTWTKWFPTNDILTLLKDTGFNLGGKTNEPPSLLNDFYMESHFGRGTIRLNKAIVLELATDNAMNAVSRHLYSRVKQIGVDQWVMPSSAIEIPDHFWHLYNLMVKHL
jgi:hypothetical protein